MYYIENIWMTTEKKLVAITLKIKSITNPTAFYLRTVGAFSKLPMN